jgi:phosphatidylinositol-binding clathrin assembly protein
LAFEVRSTELRLEHFLEMSKPDAERAVNIYKTFCKQTDKVVNYLSIARHYEHATRIEIPKMKHAPTNLISSMEEYLKDPDFDVNRRQYLAEQQSKKKGGAVNGSSRPFTDFKSGAQKSEPPSSFPEPKSANPPPKVDKGPAPDLIDFFGSIEQNQTPMAQAQYQQPQYQGQPQGTQATGFQGQNPFLPQGAAMPTQATGFPAELQGTQASAFPAQQPFTVSNGTGANPFLQMQQQQQQQQAQPQPQPQQTQQIQPNFTGAGFGGYTPQAQQPAGFQPSLSSIPQTGMASFSPLTQQPQFTTSPIVQSPTAGSNPFRQSMLPPSATGTTVSSLSSQPTASTMSSLPSNPNRQSMNPFAKPSGTPPQGAPFNTPSSFSGQPSPFTSAPPGSFGQPQPLMPAATGMNPFARNASPASSSPFSSAPVSTNPTGSTNPFRQSQFVNQTTGQGWQSGPQGTIGGFSNEQIPTMPIFPRPGAQQQQQQ